MSTMETVWEYYGKLAELNGQRRDKETGEVTMSSYSISWFYEGNTSASLNVMSRAFLGDNDLLKGMGGVKLRELTERIEKQVLEYCRGEAIEPNPAQVSAIAGVIPRPISIIQGPPGTGKTETIKNLILCLHRMLPTAKIAVVSSNREAVRNIEKLLDGHRLLGDKYAYLGNQNVRKAFMNHLEKDDPELADRFRACKEENGWRFPAEFLDRFPILLSTIHSLRKCIEPGGEFHNQFHYVIVDECSQVSPMLGMLAMASAEHLVLLGDDEQLEPIFKDLSKGTEPADLAELEKIGEQAGAFYTDEKSFMSACGKRFENCAGNFFLNEHYRSHPAIIGFCNRYVYDNKLQIRTADDGKFPVRIRWYEGDYWEDPLKHGETGKRERYNKRQIAIFLEEEYPELLDRIKHNPDYTACVLSPYRRQLELLKEEMDLYNEKKNVGQKSELEPDSDSPSVPQLTIHKVQGRGFDYVCVLPVIDTEEAGGGVWAQRKQMINVSVSRAKRELCFVMSARWMPAGMQERLLGYNLFSEEESRKGYLRKVFEYVDEYQQKGVVKDGFGLQKTSLESVFEKVPYYRLQENKAYISAPARCVLNAIVTDSFFDGFEVCTEVQLQNVKGILWEDDTDAEDVLAYVPDEELLLHIPDTEDVLPDDLNVEGSLDDPDEDLPDTPEKVQRYIQNGARFDIVLCREGRVCYIIEVDGAYHRQQNAAEYDRMKDAAVEKFLGTDFYRHRYVRIPTDGTTSFEIEAVKDSIREADRLGVTRPALKADEKGGCRWGIWDKTRADEAESKVIQTLKKELGDVCAELKEAINAMDMTGQKKTMAKLRGLDFSRGNVPDYEDIQVARYYLLRYAMAYTFEYAAIYQLALGFLRDEKNVTVYSFGCGAMVDGVALAYAREKLQDQIRCDTLSYTGIDMKEWKPVFSLDPELINRHKFFKYKMDEFMNSAYQTMGCNIICFAKLLSENLDEKPEKGGNSDFEKFCGYLRHKKLSRDRIVLCLSYRGRDTAAEDARLTGRIVKAMEENGFRLEDKEPFDGMPGLKSLDREMEVFPLEGFPCYGFSTEKGDKYLYDVDSNFAVSREVREYVSRLKNMDEQDSLREAIRKVNNMCFQVLLFVRK